MSLASACVTMSDEAGYGIQPEHQSCVPARTLILPCRAWPDGARYKSLPLTSAKDQEIAALCAAVDQYVLDAFNNQPYMKGFTPKFVQKQLDAAGKGGLIAGLAGEWAHQAGDCADCATPPGYYQASLPKRTAWLEWLSTISETVRNADAVLLPFVTFAYDKRYDDRGLDVHERAAGVVLLLVDTAKGELLWAGGREAQVPAKRLRSANVTTELAPPDWRVVQERLLSDDLWREYPGRQTL
jgi:hypothetical protein